MIFIACHNASFLVSELSFVDFVANSFSYTAVKDQERGDLFIISSSFKEEFSQLLGKSFTEVCNFEGILHQLLPNSSKFTITYVVANITITLTNICYCGN